MVDVVVSLVVVEAPVVNLELWYGLGVKPSASPPGLYIRKRQICFVSLSEVFEKAQLAERRRVGQ